VADAIRAGIFNDLGSGSNVDVCVITKVCIVTEMIRILQMLKGEGDVVFALVI